MNKKIFSISSIVLLSALFLNLAPIMAQKADDSFNSDIPEKNGVYDVPNNPKLKVRVFVHQPKVKPEPNSSPVLICSLTDLDSTAPVTPTDWHLPNGRWTYLLNTSSVPTSVGASNLPLIATSSFNTWSKTTGNKVTFSLGAKTTIDRKAFDGKNIITWGKTSIQALAVTYTWYYPSTGLVAEVDTIMNNRYAWSWTPYNPQNLCADKNSYDVQNILTHELGHWLGLDDEYSPSYVDNTMYGYGSKAEIKKDTLTTGDIAGISSIYY